MGFLNPMRSYTGAVKVYSFYLIKAKILVPSLAEYTPVAAVAASKDL